MKHTLFLVHGMGLRDPATWAEEIQQKLIDVSRRYEFFRDHDLANYTDFVPITYDDTIRDIQRQWQEAAGPVSAFAQAQELDGADALDWLDGIADEDAGFFWTHVADVIIYRLFKQYRTMIRIAVMDRFAQELNARFEADGGVRASVLAHSLGTAVAHDSLHLLGAGDVDGLVNALAMPNWRFDNFFALANLSRLLQSDIDTDESRIRPGEYCVGYFDFHHALDPATMVRAFSPRDFGSGYRHEPIEHLRQWNLHSFTHYLDNPLVHIPILDAIRPDEITRSERIAARNGTAYPVLDERFASLATLAAKLEELGELKEEIGQAAGLRDWVGVVRKGYRIFDEIKDLLAEGGPS